MTRSFRYAMFVVHGGELAEGGARGWISFWAQMHRSMQQHPEPFRNGSA